MKDEGLSVNSAILWTNGGGLYHPDVLTGHRPDVLTGYHPESLAGHRPESLAGGQGVNRRTLKNGGKRLHRHRQPPSSAMCI